MDTALWAVVVAAIAVFVNALVSIFLHWRRANFETELAEKKFSLDTKLAEQKLILDQQVATLRRAQDLAGELLSDFYQIQRMMPAIRSPASWGDEGNTRPRQDGETDNVARTRNAYYVIPERLAKNKEVISRVMSKQFLAMALIGVRVGEPFERLNGLLAKLTTAAHMLIMTAEKLPSQDYTKWEKVIWAEGKDEFQTELDAIVTSIDALCRPILSAKNMLP